MIYFNPNIPGADAKALVHFASLVSKECKIPLKNICVTYCFMDEDGLELHTELRYAMVQPLEDFDVTQGNMAIDLALSPSSTSTVIATTPTAGLQEWSVKATTSDIILWVALDVTTETLISLDKDIDLTIACIDAVEEGVELPTPVRRDQKIVKAERTTPTSDVSATKAPLHISVHSQDKEPVAIEVAAKEEALHVSPEEAPPTRNNVVVVKSGRSKGLSCSDCVRSVAYQDNTGSVYLCINKTTFLHLDDLRLVGPTALEGKLYDFRGEVVIDIKH